VHRSGRRW